MTEDPREQNDDVIINTGAGREPEKPLVTVGGGLINYIIIGVAFLAIGLLLGLNLGGNDEAVDATALRVIVNEEIRSALSGEMGDILAEAVADIEFAGGSGMDSEELSAMIAEAVEEANNRRDFLEGEGNPSLGPDDAAVVVVEFSDFLCSFCGRHFEQTLTPLLDDYDGLIRYVYRDFRGVGGQNAVEASMAAECAYDQDQFWQYHNRLFSNQQQLFTDNPDALRTVLIDHASALDLDMDTFTTCLDNDTHFSKIIRDTTEGQQNGMTGTPGFFINGTFISGAQPYEIFSAIIDEELRAAGIEPPAGGEA